MGPLTLDDNHVSGNITPTDRPRLKKEDLLGLHTQQGNKCKKKNIMNEQLQGKKDLYHMIKQWEDLIFLYRNPKSRERVLTKRGTSLSLEQLQPVTFAIFPPFYGLLLFYFPFYFLFFVLLCPELSSMVWYQVLFTLYFVIYIALCCNLITPMALYRDITSIRLLFFCNVTCMSLHDIYGCRLIENWWLEWWTYTLCFFFMYCFSFHCIERFFFLNKKRL